MELASNYNQGDRVTILVVSLFTLILLFRLHIFITVIPFECWELHEIWEHEPYHLSPFMLYVISLVLFLIWAFIELILGLFLKSGIYVRCVSALSIVTVLFIMFGFYHLWQFFQIEKEVLPKESYFWQIIDFADPLPVIRSSDLPTWREYIIQNRCDKGLAIATMTDKEKTELRESFRDMYKSLEY